MRVYSDDSIKDCSIHYNGYVLLVQVSVIDKISTTTTMVANSSGSSVFILQSRGLSPSIPQHVPHCHHLVACVPTLGLSYLSRSRYIPLQRTFGLNCRNGLICTHRLLRGCQHISPQRTILAFFDFLSFFPARTVLKNIC